MSEIKEEDFAEFSHEERQATQMMLRYPINTANGLQLNGKTFRRGCVYCRNTRLKPNFQYKDRNDAWVCTKCQKFVPTAAVLEK